MYVAFFFQSFFFEDYWEDIGTIKSFYDANMALTEEVSSRYLLLTNFSGYFFFLVVAVGTMAPCISYNTSHNVKDALVF